MLGRRPAAAADDVDEAAGREVTEQLGGFASRLVVLPESVRQTGIGIGADVSVRDARQLFDVGPELPGAQRAVETDDERPRVTDRVPERLDGLPGKRAPRRVGDRARDEDRQPERELVEHLPHSEECCLGVQRVEDRLDQDHVDAAFDQPARRLGITRGELVETGVAEARIVHLRRERRRAARGPQRAGDEAWPGRARRRLVRRAARNPGRGEVELVHQPFHAVIRLRRRAGIERIRLDDVRTGIEIAAVDLRDQLRSCDRQQIVVTFEVALRIAESFAAIFRLAQAVRLDDRAHCAVEDEDPLVEQTAELTQPLLAQHVLSPPAPRVARHSVARRAHDRSRRSALRG